MVNKKSYVVNDSPAIATTTTTTSTTMSAEKSFKDMMTLTPEMKKKSTAERYVLQICSNTVSWWLACLLMRRTISKATAAVKGTAQRI